VAIAFNANDSELAIGGADCKVHLFAFGTDAAKATKVLDGHTARVTSVIYDATQLVSTDANRAIYFWKNGEMQNNTGWTFHNGNVTQTAFNPSSTLLASCSQDQDILIWSDLVKFEHYYTRFTLSHHLGTDHVAFLDDNTVISTGVDRCIKIWNIIKGGFSIEKKEEMIKQAEKEEKKQ